MSFKLDVGCLRRKGAVRLELTTVAIALIWTAGAPCDQRVLAADEDHADLATPGRLDHAPCGIITFRSDSRCEMSSSQLA